MTNTIYNIGDRVRLLNTRGLPGAVKGKVYKIIDVNATCYLLSIKGGTHSTYNGTNAGWWYVDREVEYALKIGEQMLFDFMQEDVK